MNPQRSRQQTLPDWILAALPLFVMGLAMSLLVASMVTRVVWGGPTSLTRFGRVSPLRGWRPARRRVA